MDGPFKAMAVVDVNRVSGDRVAPPPCYRCGSNRPVVRSGQTAFAHWFTCLQCRTRWSQPRRR
jgi:hypothetical protein